MGKKSTENRLTVQTTTGEQLVFIFKYKDSSTQKEGDLLKNILLTRIEEAR